MTVSHRATSSDSHYNTIAIRNVGATVVDDDGAGLTVTESNGSTSVTGATGVDCTDSYTMNPVMREQSR